MNRDQDAAAPAFSSKHAFGCLGIAAASLALAGMCIVLGVMCMAKHGAFSCIGLWSVFPLVFFGVGLVSAAVGFQRFTSAGRAPVSAPIPPIAGPWQTVRGPARGPRSVQPAPEVIHLPGRRVEPPDPPRGESEEA